MSSWIHLGNCHRPHGIQGGFALHLFSGENSVLDAGMKIELRPCNSESSLPLEGKCYRLTKLHHQKKVAYLQDISKREQVEALTPFDIFLKRQDFPPLPGKEDSFYLADLLGLKAIDHQSGQEIGEVASFSDNSAQTLLEIHSEGKILFTLPFVDAFFPAIDVQAGWLEVVPPQMI